jgi:RND family efflux transporter MFP subunit
MNNTPDKTTPAGGSQPLKTRCSGSVISTFFRVILPVVFLGGGIAAAVYFIKTAPEAEQKTPDRHAQLVSVTTANRSNYSVVVRAMGTVIPSKRITLQPRVSGQLTEVSDKFVPGGRFDKGETIVKVDSEDYDLIVRQRTADIVRANHDLKIEKGQQVIAKREFELIRRSSTNGLSASVDRDLMLRKPQLELAQAGVDSAQAALDKAQLDLKRTTITAPFNAVILEKQQVDLGSQVSPATQMALLAGTDEFWVLASVPISTLAKLNIPGGSKPLEGSAVRIYNKTSWSETTHRTGRIVGLLGTLETKGRLARVLVSVKDPLGLTPTDPKLPKRQKLLVGMYVTLEADGKELKNVVRIDRTSLRDNDTVWVFAKDGTLDIREVEVAWRDREVVYVSDGLEDGEQIVTSDLAVRVSGSPLKIDAPATQPASQPASRPGDPRK